MKTAKRSWNARVPATLIGLAIAALVALPGHAETVDLIAIKFYTGPGSPTPTVRDETVDKLAKRLGVRLRFAGFATDGAVKLALAQPLGLPQASALVENARSIPGVLYADIAKSAARGRDNVGAYRANSPAPKTDEVEPPVQQLIVRTRRNGNVPADRLSALSRLSSAAGVSMSLGRSMDRDTFIARLPQPMPQAQAYALAERLQRDASVVFVEPDIMLFARAGGAGGSSCGSQATPIPSSQWNLQSNGIDIYSVWQQSLSDPCNQFLGNPGMIVAVVDSGVRPHAALQPRLLPGYDFVSDPSLSADGDGRDADATDPGGYGACGLGLVPTLAWHGTRVAGIIGSQGEVAGIDAFTRILPVRAIGPCGGLASDIADAIKWAAGLPVDGAPANTTPARVINLSLGATNPTCPSIFQEAINAAITAGVSVVTAAGNDLADAINTTPANCAGAIAVGATDYTGARAPYSNWGRTVDFMAPGGTTGTNCAGELGLAPCGILSTSNTGSATPGSDTTAEATGTSFAAPHVTALLGLVLGKKAMAPFQAYTLLADAAVPSPSSCATSVPSSSNPCPEHGLVRTPGSLDGVANVVPSMVESIDAAFGTGGFTLFGVPASQSDFQSVSPGLPPLVDGSGRLLFAYAIIRPSDSMIRTVLARAAANGLPDATFGPSGGDGTPVYDFSQICNGAAASSGAESWALQSTGKILVSALANPRSGFCVVRFNADGTLDTSFGTNGRVLAPYSGDSFDTPRGSAIIVRPDDSFYVSRTTCIGGALPLARFSSLGVLDASWGTAGILQLPIAAGDCATYGGMVPKMLADGSFYIAGNHEVDPWNYDSVWLRRYTSAGVLDATFGTSGRVAFSSSAAIGGAYFKNTDMDRAVRIEGSSIYILQGVSNGLSYFSYPIGTGAVMMRTNLSGQLDATFGSGGYVVLNPLPDPDPDPTGPFRDVVGILVQANGKVIGLGSKQAFRLMPSGALDTGFGNAGRIEYAPLGVGTYIGAHDVTARPNGSLVITGTYSHTTAYATHAFMASFLAGEPTASTACYVDPATSQCVTTGGLGLGDRPVGSLGAPMAVTFTNSGAFPLTIYSVVAAGVEAAGEFTLVGHDCGTILAAGASCTIYVRFAPTQTGERHGRLYITTNAVEGTFVIPLVGNGTTGPALTAVKSRRTHGSAGTFDLDVDPSQALAGAVSVEPRAIGSGLLVFQFNMAITSVGGASVSPIGSASAAINGNSVEVSVTNVPDNKRVTVSLSGVNGGTAASTSIGFLIGDVDGTRSVTQPDIDAIKARCGQATDATVAPYDLDLSGAVTASDILMAKGRLTLSIP